MVADETNLKIKAASKMPDQETTHVIDDDEAESACLAKLTDILTSPGGRRTNDGPAELADHLYVGSALDAVDRRLLNRLRITHILNCTSAETIRDYSEVGYQPRTDNEACHIRSPSLPARNTPPLSSTNGHDRTVDDGRRWKSSNSDEYNGYCGGQTRRTETCCPTKDGGAAEYGRQSASALIPCSRSSLSANNGFPYLSANYGAHSVTAVVRPYSSSTSAFSNNIRSPLKRYARSYSSAPAFSPSSPATTSSASSSFAAVVNGGSRPTSLSSTTDFRYGGRQLKLHPVNGFIASVDKTLRTSSSSSSMSRAGSSFYRAPTTNGYHDDCDQDADVIIIYRGDDGSPYDPRRSTVRAYLEIGADDTPGYPLLKRHYTTARRFIDSAREAGGRALIHCELGINRSAALAVAYMIDTEGMALMQAVRQLRIARPNVLRNEGFRRQLVRFAAERRLTDGRKTDVSFG